MHFLIGAISTALKRALARRRGAILIGLGLAQTAAPAQADPNALWRIVHEACVPHYDAGQGPKPCEAIDASASASEDVAILKDLNGVAQMLAIPTRKITGIEDPQMLQPDAPPVFADGWKAKTLVEGRLGGRTLPREAIALAINSQYARSQEQMHVHVDCVRPDVIHALADYAPSLDDQWRPMTVALEGRKYLARRLVSDDLFGQEPLLRLLADGLPDAKGRMGAMSLGVVGAEFDGKPGFVLIADISSLEGGGHAEDIQDHNCAIARSAP